MRWAKRWEKARERQCGRSCEWENWLSFACALPEAGASGFVKGWHRLEAKGEIVHNNIYGKIFGLRFGY